MVSGTFRKIQYALCVKDQFTGGTDGSLTPQIQSLHEKR